MAPAFPHCDSHPGKRLTGHLQDVADRLARHGPLLRDAGLFHDVGKGTDYFQDYLNGKPVSDMRLKQHAHLGAMWLLHHLLPQVASGSLRIEKAVLAYMMVDCHHTGLKNALDSLSAGDEAERCRKQIQAMDAGGTAAWLETVLNQAVGQPNLDVRWSKLRVQLSAAFRQSLTDLATMNRFQDALRSFGLLIEADRDSASGFAPDAFQSAPRFAQSHLEHFRAAGKFGAPADVRVVRARDAVYQAAVAGAHARPTNSGHLWSLTVPTGAGKTLAAIGWALRRREARVAAGLPSSPIIYALPFTSIIDQNVGVLRRVWGSDEADESTLAVHHHIAEPGQLARRGEQSLARSWVEGWRADIVCTTFVQVVNALFHGTVADARRFSRLAGSILILDEVQAIPSKFWALINTALAALSSGWGTDVLLMTATQPAIFRPADLVELRPELPEMSTDAFDRYDLFAQTGQELSIESLADRVCAELADARQPSCLVIVNTIQEALDLFSLVRSRIKRSDYPVFHLSTNLRPKDRKSILHQLADYYDRPHLLVATQVVEAGVDLSFDIVFRALAPLDAVVQAAGRCNRHGTGRRGKVFLVSTKGNTGHFIYGNKEMGAAREVLENAAGQDRLLSEPKLRDCVVDYFRVVAARSGRDVFGKIMEAIRTWEFASIRGDVIDAQKDREKVVSLIDERDDTIAHYIEMDDSDVAVWRQVCDAAAISDPRQRRARLRRLRPEFGQRVIEIPKKFAFSLDPADFVDVVYVPQASAVQQYDIITGWRRVR